MAFTNKSKTKNISPLNARYFRDKNRRSSRSRSRAAGDTGKDGKTKSAVSKKRKEKTDLEDITKLRKEKERAKTFATADYSERYVRATFNGVGSLLFTDSFVSVLHEYFFC